jgi:hypothetical protein
MKLDKIVSTRIFLASALAPILIFAVFYFSGLDDWATTGMKFQDCSDGLKFVLEAVAAMLHIVFALLLLLALLACVATLSKGWKPFAASLIIHLAIIYFFYKMALPGNFAFAGTDSLIVCSASGTAPLKLTLAFLGACASLGLSGFFGVIGTVMLLRRNYRIP